VRGCDPVLQMPTLQIIVASTRQAALRPLREPVTA
jgi:hypothetical protein